jgi:hypothetical protein
MKRLSTAIILLLTFDLFCQENIVPNSGFENGTFTDFNCDYEVGGSTGPFGGFSGLADWQTCETDNSEQDNQNSIICPMWINLNSTSCADDYTSSWQSPALPVISPSNKFLKFRVLFQDAGIWQQEGYKQSLIRVLLKENLQPYAHYIIRYKFLTNGTGKEENFYSQAAGISFSFTTYMQHWKSNESDNHKFNLDNISYSVRPSTSGRQWVQYEGIFQATTSYHNIRNLVIGSSNVCFVDDVEIYEWCPENMYIQNRVFPSVIDYPIVNSDDNYIKYASGNKIISGNNVDNSQTTGNVIVNGNIKFSAANTIVLKPGFIASKGSNFIARIEDGCEVNRLPSYKIDTILEDNTISNIATTPAYSFHPNPNSGQFTLTQTQEGYIKTYSIIDITGRPLLTSPMGRDNTASTIEISLEDLPKGIYILQLETTEGMKAERVVYQ